MSRIVVIGATSTIARHACRQFAGEHADFLLMARNEDKLASVRQDLQARGAGKTEIWHCEDFNQAYKSLLEKVNEALGGMDILLIAHGTLPDQARCEADTDYMLAEFSLNAVSVIAMLNEAANYFEQQKQGCIAAISSVAGDRGRKSNYINGVAKGTVTLFMQGLRNRLASSGVTVVTIKPGFVDTPMTAAFKKGLLWASPETVGQGIYKAIKAKRDVVYLPWFWRWIMLIIKMIPERIFKRMSL